ncbi:MAG: hypothetical protein O2890_08350 [Cyanobacteria bacterium]|nr:hypothetical protein [Cyanobacteriota bacterium]MDA0866416.1 hypothetical protein [Cyanobacteriota bacterium]
MNPTLEALFNEPEKRYLQPDELNVLSQYVSSVPERIQVYRQLRDSEVQTLQPVADQLQQRFSQVPEAILKRSIQHGLLVLRYAAMAMLIDDPSFLTKRLQPWLPEMVAAFDTLVVDEALHQLLAQRLSSTLTAQQFALLSPALVVAQQLLERAPSTNLAREAPLVGIL